MLAAFFPDRPALVGAIALAIKLGSPGPVFYGHRRRGRTGQEFTAWKFRTMAADADVVLAKHLARTMRRVRNGAPRGSWPRSARHQRWPLVAPEFT